jgi:hypothetical protein
MSKTFEFTCPKHGHIKIEVEKPSIVMTRNVYCPFCAQRLSNKPADKEKWQVGYTSAEAPA